MFRILIVLSALLALAAIAASPGITQEGRAMVEVSYSGHATYPLFTRLVFQTGGTGPSGFKINHDVDGRRVVFYPRAGLLAFSFAPVEPLDEVVRGVDFVQSENTKRGIVVMLGPAASAVKASYLSDPDRLVLDIYRKTAETPFMPLDRPVRTIALDPGHGGMSAGSKSPEGLAEKDLALDVSIRLRRLLVRDGFKVVLTRERDQDVSPDMRAGLANYARCDLYLSVHASGSFGEGKGEVTIYTQDAEVTRPGGNMLAWEDQNSAYLSDSMGLAWSLSAALNGLYGDKPRLRQARLAGVEGAAMPAALVELGGLSDPEQSSALSEDSFRDKLAARLERGINDFVKGVYKK